MAKTKSKAGGINIPANLGDRIVDAIDSKLLKSGGLSYRLTGSYKVHGQNDLPPGCILRECNDGWYRVEHPEKKTVPFRLKINGLMMAGIVELIEQK